MDETAVRCPAALEAIEQDTAATGFTMGSDRRTGALLRVLAATKPGSFLLELGTGTGLSTAWILDGMSPSAALLSVDSDRRLVEVARRHLRGDGRVTFFCQDAAEFLTSLRGRKFDFIFADTWVGKFCQLDDALALLGPGGFYVADDLLPQPGWPDGHAREVQRFLAELEARRDLTVVPLCWSTGLVIATKCAS